MPRSLVLTYGPSQLPQPTDTTVVRAGSVNDVGLSRLGQDCEKYVQQGKRAFIYLAVTLATAKEAFGGSGRDSRFDKWLKHHAPELSRKTVDRMVSVVTAFGLNTDNVSDFASLVAQFRLTALYGLASEDVPESARMEAVLAAQSGETITPRYVRELLERDAVPDYLLPPPTTATDETPETFQRTIELPAGQVSISINHDDFRQALHEAMYLLDEGQ